MEKSYDRPSAAPAKCTSLCIKCGKELERIDIGLYKKMVNRGADKFMCIDCLGEEIGVSREMLLEKAEQFKKAGCTLF